MRNGTFMCGFLIKAKFCQIAKNKTRNITREGKRSNIQEMPSICKARAIATFCAILKRIYMIMFKAICFKRFEYVTNSKVHI